MNQPRANQTRDNPSSLPPHLFRNKAAGWVFMNGNIPNPLDFVKMFAEQILEPEHQDPEVDRARRVTLITAAFDKGHEFHDRHLIHHFERIGLDARWKGGFPTRIRNLSLWTSFDRWKKSEKWLYQRYTEKQDAIVAIKKDYYLKTQTYIDRILENLTLLTAKFPTLGLFELYYFDNWEPDPGVLLSESARESETLEAELDRLKKSPSARKRARELRAMIDHLVYKDSEVLAACRGIEAHFRHESGLERSELYLRQQAALKQTLLESATIFLYGGRVFVLMNRLRFYDLDETFRQAVARGTNLFGISAGSVIQSNQFSLALPGAPSGGHQIAADDGVGLIGNVKIFPHAYDYHEYLREGSRNDLSLFALRHPGCVAVGLNQSSVLLREEYRCTKDKRNYLRYSSVGDDPVLVFGPRGRRYEMLKGDQLLLPGTRGYSGMLGLGRLEELEEIESQCLQCDVRSAVDGSQTCDMRSTVDGSQASDVRSTVDGSQASDVRSTVDGSQASDVRSTVDGSQANDVRSTVDGSQASDVRSTVDGSQASDVRSTTEATPENSPDDPDSSREATNPS